MSESAKKFWKKLFRKVKFEYKMWKKDIGWFINGVRDTEPYPPSFYYRNPPEVVEKAMAEHREKKRKEYEEMREMVNEYRRRLGVPVKGEENSQSDTEKIEENT